MLLEGNPHLHRIVALDTLEWRKHLTSSATWQEIRNGVSDLRRTLYSAALDFQGLWKSAVVAWLSRAQERIGFAERWLREPSAAILYTQRVSPREHVHVVEENLALVERLGARTERWQFPLPWNDEDDAYVDTQLAALDSEDFIIINPGGGWRSKCWSPENYAALIRQLAGARREQILLTGSPSEEPLIGEILQSAGDQARTLLPHHPGAVHRPGKTRAAFHRRRYRPLAPGGRRGRPHRRHLRPHRPGAQRPVCRR